MVWLAVLVTGLSRLLMDPRYGSRTQGQHRYLLSVL